MLDEPEHVYGEQDGLPAEPAARFTQVPVEQVPQAPQAATQQWPSAAQYPLEH